MTKNTFLNRPEKPKTKDVILVVDDQPNNLKVIASVLGRDYAVSIANSGTNALRILENSTPDLILLDIMMPDMDGFEVCRKIRENDRIRHIPIIFLTAKADVEDVVKGFNAGAVDYITKPFNATEVDARVRNHLNLQHALKEVKSANQKLNEINATKDKFFSVIGHDLRSPFASIIALSGLLGELVKEKDYDGIEEYSALIEQSSKRAMDLLTNLLEWARSQTGRIEFKPEKTKLVHLIEETARMFDQIAKQKNISIKRMLPEDHEIFADKHMVSTVMRNLISNALKFTRPGGEVSISARSEKDEIVITVSDNGVGIDSQRIENLFHIEYSASTYGTANEKGTGLGLTLCKEFIEKHGGRIWVESEEGKGSVFSFSIPCSVL